MGLRQGIAGVVLAAALVFAPAAEATVFKGKTSGGRQAKLETGRGGEPRLVDIDWKAPCKKQGLAFVASTAFSPPFDQVGPNRVVDRGSYRSRDGRLLFRIRAEVSAERRTDALWKGDFSSRVRVFADGEPFTTCKARGINWYAKARGA